MAVYKVNISLPEDLVSEIDEAANALGLSRSGFIAEASSRYVTDVRELTAEERRRKDIQRALFLALAEQLDCPLVTADRKAFTGIDSPVEIRLI